MSDFQKAAIYEYAAYAFEAPPNGSRLPAIPR
jgi:hypothetical protein